MLSRYVWKPSGKNTILYSRFKFKYILYLKYNIFKASDKAKAAINQKITKIELQRDPSVKIYILTTFKNLQYIFDQV